MKHQVIPEWIFYIENNNKVFGGHTEPLEDNNKDKHKHKGNKESSVMSVGSLISAARWKKKKNTAGLPSIGFKILTRCDVAVIPSKALDSKGEWVHVPCLSLGFSESRSRYETFTFNLHGKNAELGVNSICHSACFLLSIA